MRININYCGTNSITGAICEKVIELGLTPDHIIVDINVVMCGTDVNKELAKAKEIYHARKFSIELGTVAVDLYKQQLECDPKNTVCYS